MRLLKHKCVIMLACALLLAGCAANEPSGLNEIFTRARRLTQQKQIANASELLDAAIAKHPEDWKLRRAVFRFWALENKPQKAADIGLSIFKQRNKFVKPTPMRKQDIASFAVELSSVFRMSGRPDKEREMLEEALKLNPHNAEAANNIAYELALNGRNINRALNLAKRAVKAKPDNGDYADTLGWVYFKMGRLDDANEWISRAVRLSPNSAELRSHLAEVCLRKRDIPKAYVETKKALILSPSLAEAKALANLLKREYYPIRPF